MNDGLYFARVEAENCNFNLQGSVSQSASLPATAFGHLTFDQESVMTSISQRFRILKPMILMIILALAIPLLSMADASAKSRDGRGRYDRDDNRRRARILRVLSRRHNHPWDERDGHRRNRRFDRRWDDDNDRRGRRYDRRRDRDDDDRRGRHGRRHRDRDDD